LNFKYVRLAEICQAEPQVTEPSAFEVEMSPENLKIHKLSKKIKVKNNCLKQQLGKFILKYISLLIIFGIKRNYQRSERSREL
jgi:hypothetical protein